MSAPSEVSVVLDKHGTPVDVPKDKSELAESLQFFNNRIRTNGPYTDVRYILPLADRVTDEQLNYIINEAQLDYFMHEGSAQYMQRRNNEIKSVREIMRQWLKEIEG